MTKKMYVTSPYLKNARLTGQIDGQQLVQALEHYISIYRKLKKQFKAPDRARIFHRLIDELTLEAAKNYPNDFAKIQCRKGCAFCCYQNVDVTFDEATLLIETVQIDWPAVEAQALFETNRSKRCVFLQEDNTCGVYENRPASCRKYLVVSAPSKCDLNNPENSGDVEVLGLRDPEVIASAAMNVSDSGPMATMLLKARKFI